MFGILVAESMSVLFLQHVARSLTCTFSAILTIRVWALWGRRKDIGILLILVSVVDFSASLVIYTLYGPSFACKCRLE